jgi:hypothetical protein
MSISLLPFFNSALNMPSLAICSVTKYIDDERGPQVPARLWGTPSAALGKWIRYLPDLPWHEVIGVVQDVRENGVYEAAPPTAYWPTMSASLNARPGRPNAIRGVNVPARRAASVDPVEALTVE